MSLWVDIKYADMIGMRTFEGFKVQKRTPYQANFRCPHCGDSHRNRRKKRGFLLERGDHLHMMCHNCGYSAPFGPSLRKLDPLLYREYIVERLKEQGSSRPKQIRYELVEPSFKPDITKFSRTRVSAFFAARPGAVKVSSLPADHAVRRYINQRCIPPAEHHRMYVVAKFKQWINSFVQDGKFADGAPDGPRLVLPLADQDGYVFGLTARTLSKQEPKYLTIMLNPDAVKVFGLDRVSLEHDVFLVEGPIDSLFLPNALAMCGTDVDLSNIIPADQLIVAYDNEPRNPEVVRRMHRAIESGSRIVIWPESLSAYKDINDMVQKGGLDPMEVHAIMRHHTYRSLSARLALARWSRC